MNKQNTVVTWGIGAVVAAIAFIAGVNASTTTLGNTVNQYFSGQPDTELPDDLNYSEVERVYDELRASYFGELTAKQLLEGAKRGLVEAADDPYTTYLDAEAAAEFDQNLNNEFSGIGAEIAVKNGQLQIQSPLPDTPASRAGLMPGDLILEIDGESTEGLRVEEAVVLIRGEADTPVTLTILRDRGQPQEVEIVRDEITVPNASGEILEGNIGYIELNTFGEDAVRQTKALAEQFAEANVDGIVLDMRNNPGGLLQAAVDIASLWIDGQEIVTQRGIAGQNSTYKARPGGPLAGLPTVVLINGGSASASEIVAGALQDYDIAEVIGQTSFGKGSVQVLEKLPGGAELKITVAEWFTPNGQNIAETGIVPDKEIELTEEDFNNDRDPQLEAALKALQD